MDRAYIPKFCRKCVIENIDPFSASFCSGCGSLLQLSLPSGSLKTGTILENRYKIITLIKSEAGKNIYKAIESKFDTIYAVKELIPPEKRDDEGRIRFKRKVKFLGKLDNAGLVKIMDYFVYCNRYYMVMEFIPGRDLNKILQEEGKKGLPRKKVLNWARDILNVLDYLHSHSPPVIYGDIKPENIMERRDNKLILLDFGLTEGNTNEEGISNPGYAPPERYEGQNFPASDIYSLGATMYHLLTGVRPVSHDFKPLREVKPDINRKLETAVMKALNSNMSERFSSAGEMLDALSYKTSRIEIKEKKEIILKGSSSNSQLVLIPGGVFKMGSDAAYSGERPIHTVEISTFFMDKYPLTNRDFCGLLNSAGNHLEGGVHWIEIKAAKWCGITGGPVPGSFKLKSGYENIPVVRVSWYGAVAYCNWLSKQEGLEPCYGPKDSRGDDPSVWRTKNGYRLPTEAEWEYACRAGTTTAYYWGDDMNDDYCWYLINSRDNLHRAGEKTPNSFGLYDMSGNVSEWCSDWYGPYSEETQKDPAGPEEGQARVPRGGGCGSEATYCRSASRSCSWPTVRYEYLGFRIAKNPG